MRRVFIHKFSTCTILVLVIVYVWACTARATVVVLCVCVCVCLREVGHNRFYIIINMHTLAISLHI